MDAVLAECSLSLMEEKGSVLEECFRVLKREGHLLLTDMYARNPRAEAHLRTLPKSCVSGLPVQEQLEAQVRSHGFRIERWEDHSSVLSQLMFRFVMKHGSLRQLWKCEGSKKGDADRIGQAMRDARPGYYLLIAVKRTTIGDETP
jgi:SAM-dependent methyltransferase